MNCFFFGVVGRAGHYLHDSGGPAPYDERVTTYGPERRHIDGTLAPRRGDRTEQIFFSGYGPRDDNRQYRSEECPQGQYLHHVLPNGYSAVQWWDRTQGDTRGGCNSTILLQGMHDAEAVLAAGRERFPKVFENLKKAGVELVRVWCTPSEVKTTW